MKRAKDPLYRLALRVCGYLQKRHRQEDPLLEGQLAQAAECCRSLCRHFEQYRHVRGRGWQMAGDKKRQDLLFALRTLQKLLAGDWLSRPIHHVHPVPAVAFVLEELRSLHQEFACVQIEPKLGRISVRTDAIELQGVQLGRFEIQLFLSRFGSHPDSHCFDCVALDPNPASCNESITHPHVKNNDLCAGDATSAIAMALREGRLVDAFVLVNSVLHTYGEGSPYVSLDQWAGANCPDCGQTTSLEQMSYCDGCERDVCDRCMSRCDVCSDSCCRSCLEQDTATGQQCCPACFSHCNACGRVVRSDLCEENDGLCPECLAQRPDDPDPSPESQENSTDEPNEQQPDQLTSGHCGSDLQHGASAGESIGGALVEPSPRPRALLPV